MYRWAREIFHQKRVVWRNKYLLSKKSPLFPTYKWRGVSRAGIYLLTR